MAAVEAVRLGMTAVARNRFLKVMSFIVLSSLLKRVYPVMSDAPIL